MEKPGRGLKSDLMSTSTRSALAAAEWKAVLAFDTIEEDDEGESTVPSIFILFSPIYALSPSKSGFEAKIATDPIRSVTKISPCFDFVAKLRRRSTILIFD